jgi:hypothetical protein
MQVLLERIVANKPQVITMDTPLVYFIRGANYDVPSVGSTKSQFYHEAGEAQIRRLFFDAFSGVQIRLQGPA